MPHEDCFKTSDIDVSEFQVSPGERLDSEDKSGTNSNYGVVQLGAMATEPCQDEPQRTMGIKWA